MKQYAALALVIMLAFTIITGCTENGRPQDTVIPTRASTAEPTAIPTHEPAAIITQEPTAAPTAEPAFAYTLDFHKTTPMIDSIVGEAVMEVTADIIDAFISYDTSVTVDNAVIEADELFMDKLQTALYTYCPPFMAYANFNPRSAHNAEQGIIKWDIYINESELTSKLKRLESEVARYFERLRTGDADTLMAILIYNDFTRRCAYDYEMENCFSMTKDVRLKTSSYMAITRGSGVCYSFAYALAFLYTQAGIDCTTVHGNSQLGQHRWVLINLNDTYYYCDPTWDLGGSFSWFGVTSAFRAEHGSYSENQSFLIKDPVTDTYPIDDERFSILYKQHQHEFFNPSNMIIDRENRKLKFMSEQGAFTIDCD